MKANLLPNWYGIKDVKYVWHGEWSDAEILYKGNLINSTIIENSMIESYRDYLDENNIIDDNYDNFDKYMLDNKDEVIEFCEMYLDDAIEHKIIDESSIYIEPAPLNGNQSYNVTYKLIL